MKKLFNFLKTNELLQNQDVLQVKGGMGEQNEDDKRRERPGGIQTQRGPSEMANMNAVLVTSKAR